MIHTILRDQNPYFRTYLGRYLKQKRLGADLASKVVASRLGITEASYRGMESGRSKVTSEIVEALFPILHLDMQELYEISTISKIACANDIAKELSENYPS